MKPSMFVVEDDPGYFPPGAPSSRRRWICYKGLSPPEIPSSPIPSGNGLALFVLDIMVPGKDGLELCRQIRQTQSLAPIPVIFLTAKSGEADRILGLELGADDYIPKPFSPRELVARVKAVLRRFERPLSQAPVKIGDIEIDPGAMTLTVAANLVTTTATEFRLAGLLRPPYR